jgi:DNA primase
MARIAREIVEAVRDRTDIVEVIQRSVQLKKQGDSWVGLCPFHQEKSPSFHVVPKKAMYHCFGCQASGDAFKFLQEISGLSFVEAVKELAGPAGVTIEERELTQAERESLNARRTLYDVMEEACLFFQAQLMTAPDAQVARDYLFKKRGMTQDTVTSARLGWAPDSWTRLLDHLHQKGFRPQMVMEAGLAKKRERGDGHYDTFRARVIVPIRDDRQRVIAFGGRILEGDGPKYINSPENKLYKKHDVLYGLETARRAIGQKDRIILVEGYFDVLSMHQAGFLEAVATCGTALTKEHVHKIRTLTLNAVVLTDADEAGMKAAEKTLPMFSEVGVQAWRLQIPGAKDPDELIREEGPDAMTAALNQLKPMLTWVTERKLEAYGYGATARERARNELAELLHGLSPAQVSEVAPILRLDERELLVWAKAFRPPQPAPLPQADAPEPARVVWKPTRDLVHLLWLVIHRYAYIADLAVRIHESLLVDHEPILPTFARMVHGEPVAAVLDDCVDPDVRRALSQIVARTELYTADESTHAFAQVVSRLARDRTDADLARAQSLAQAASQAGRAADARAAISALQHLQARKRALGAALAASDWSRVVDLTAPIDPSGPPQT